jgi:hypothetical protein
MLLRSVHVSPHKYLVILARLQLLIYAPFIVKPISQDKCVRDRTLQEFGGDVRKVSLVNDPFTIWGDSGLCPLSSA